MTRALACLLLIVGFAAGARPAFAMGSAVYEGNGWHYTNTVETTVQGANADGQTLEIGDGGSIIVTAPTVFNNSMNGQTNVNDAVFTTHENSHIIVNGTNGIISSSVGAAINVRKNASNGGHLVDLTVAAGNTVTSSSNGYSTVYLNGNGSTHVENNGTISKTNYGTVFDLGTQDLELLNNAGAQVLGSGLGAVFNILQGSGAPNTYGLTIVNRGDIIGNGSTLIDTYNGLYNVATSYTQLSGNTVGNMYLGVSPGSHVSIAGGTYTGNVFMQGTNDQFALSGGTFTGDIWEHGSSATYTVSGGDFTGTVLLDGTNNQFSLTGGTFTGSVDSEAGNGDFIIDNAQANLTGATIAPNINVSNHATLNLGAAPVSMTAAAVTIGATSTLDLGSAAHTLDGSLVLASNSILRTAVNGDTAQDNGKLSVSGSIQIANGAKLDIGLPTGADMVTGSKDFTILSGAGANTGSFTLANNYLFYDVTDVSTAGNRTIRIARHTEPVHTVYSANANNQAAALAAFSASNPGGELGAFQSRVNAATAQGSLDQALSEVQPQADASASATAFSTAIASIGAVETRLGTLAGGQRGLNAGDETGNKHVWLQGFGGTASQGQSGGVAGYGADTGGLAVGVDKQLSESDATIGASFSYATGSIDSHDGVKSTDVDSYQGTVYAAIPVDTGLAGTWRVDGMLGFAWNNFDTDRRITVPALTAKGTYDGQTYLARLGATRNYDLGSGLSLSPGAALTYAYNRFGDYSEHGAGGLDLAVQQKNANLLESKIGSGIGYSFTTDEGVAVRPGVHANYIYDIVTDDTGHSSTFAGGGAAFRTDGQAMARNGFNVGADLSMYSADGIDLLATYDFETRSGYNSHTGQLRLRQQF